MTFSSEMPSMSFEKAAGELQIPLHVLHFWVKKFPCFSAQKAGKGKIEEFSHHDLLIARGLHRLLFVEKKTIKAVQTLISEKGVNHLISLTAKHAETLSVSPVEPIAEASVPVNSSLEDAKSQLEKSGIVEQMRDMISNVDDFVKNVTSFDEQHNELQGKHYDDVDDDEYLPAEPPEQYRPVKSEPLPQRNTIPVDENESAVKKPTPRKKPIKDTRPALQKKVELTKEKSPDISETEDIVEIGDSLSSDMTIESHVVTSPPLGWSMEQEILKNTLLKIDLLRKDLQATQKVVSEVLKTMGYSGFTNAYEDYDRLDVSDILPIHEKKKQ